MVAVKLSPTVDTLLLFQFVQRGGRKTFPYIHCYYFSLCGVVAIKPLPVYTVKVLLFQCSVIVNVTGYLYHSKQNRVCILVYLMRFLLF